MFNLKNVRSLWIYGVLLGLLILGGAVFAFTRDSVFSKTWNVFSICVFSPDINSKNKALIDETITTVAEDGLFSLMEKKTHLKQIGAILSEEVPDLAYWAYVLSTPKLLEGMKNIQGSSLKYDGFIEGTRDKLMKEYHENPCLLDQAKGFAEYLNIPEEQTVAILKNCIEKNEDNKEGFKEFLDYIIAEKSK